MSPRMKTVVGLALSVILISLGFIGGAVFSEYRDRALALPDIQQQSVVNERVDEVLRILDENALKPPSEASATAATLHGLVEGTDTYGMYLDPKHFTMFNEEMSGEFGGIGVTLNDKDGTAYVVEVFDGTPAKRGGLKSGDRFAGINGERRAKWPTDEVVKRVRGKAGTSVTLTMMRPGKPGVPGKVYTVKLVREMITYPNTTSKMMGKTGYIRMAQFNDNATKEITDAIEKLRKKGAKSFVLDLRDNPGGSLNQAIQVASLFIKSGVIVRVDERNKPEDVQMATGRQLTEAPLVVLVNGNSASASEIVAGALQDYGRATLVGEKSFGKGSVQTIKQLSFGGAIKFTIAHYLTPKKRAINGKGLTPDVVVKMDIEKQADPKTDTQLQRALKIAGGGN